MCACVLLNLLSELRKRDNIRELHIQLYAKIVYLNLWI